MRILGTMKMRMTEGLIGEFGKRSWLLNKIWRVKKLCLDRLLHVRC